MQYIPAPTTIFAFIAGFAIAHAGNTLLRDDDDIPSNTSIITETEAMTYEECSEKIEAYKLAMATALALAEEYPDHSRVGEFDAHDVEDDNLRVASWDGMKPDGGNSRACMNVGKITNNPMANPLHFCNPCRHNCVAYLPLNIAIENESVILLLRRGRFVSAAPNTNREGAMKTYKDETTDYT